MAVYGIPDNPSLTTHSWVRAWWLHSLWGYKVLDVRRNPKEGWFGRLTYEARALEGRHVLGSGQS